MSPNRATTQLGAIRDLERQSRMELRATQERGQQRQRQASAEAAETLANARQRAITRGEEQRASILAAAERRADALRAEADAQIVALQHAHQAGRENVLRRMLALVIDGEELA